MSFKTHARVRASRTMAQHPPLISKFVPYQSFRSKEMLSCSYPGYKQCSAKVSQSLPLAHLAKGWCCLCNSNTIMGRLAFCSARVRLPVIATP
eukprot:scaffold379106_cov33-Prasinocladus_malaysianus.AAC.1